MSDHVFIEEKGYFFNAYARETASGEWEATVYFEKVNDHTQTFVPGMKHRIKATFRSQREALEAATEYGFDRVNRDDTGL